jgi:hypothetical protein
LDLEEGVIWLGDEEHNKVVAEVQLIATYTPDDSQFLWVWANQKFDDSAAPVAAMRDANPDVLEFSEPILTCNEIKSWTLAAAAAYTLKAETCYRLPGDVHTFLALFNVTEIPPTDPRHTRPVRDPDQASKALADYAGATAMAIGGMLIVGLKNHNMDSSIEALYRFADKLSELGKSPVGKDTPAADEAKSLAELVRQQVIHISYPPEHPDLLEGISKVLSFLEALARKYDAWPGED